MEATEKNIGNRQTKIIILFVVIAIGFTGLTLIPQIRTRLTGLIHFQRRVVLAKITGFFSSAQTQFLILKVKDNSGLQIEVYEIDPAATTTTSTMQKFIQKFDLADDADSYVTLDKNSTNLALQDIDQDGYLDIVAPSVDRNGNLRLNTFRYNPDLKMFEPYFAKPN